MAQKESWTLWDFVENLGWDGEGETQAQSELTEELLLLLEYLILMAVFVFRQEKRKTSKTVLLYSNVLACLFYAI